MADEESKGVVEGARETAGDVVREADRGQSERTPVIALSGVMLVVAAAVGVVLLIAFLVYFLA
ncbi:MAG: hypothetical protein ICV64_12845 [Thermoleophilia bacterium]|nr:hypothetical protein [Thermoleophilia bacterium]